MKSRVIVSAVIRKGNYLLFGKKAEGIGPYPGKWLIIGGGLKDEKESMEDGLRREIREEAGIEITNIKRFDFGEDYAEKKGESYHLIFLNYIVDYLSGEPKPGDDITKLKWVHKSELKEVNFCKPTLELLTKMKYIS